MIAAIRALFASRKFVLLLVGAIVAIGGRYGVQLDTEIVGMIVGLFAVAIGAIAYEDAGTKRVLPGQPVKGELFKLDPVDGAVERKVGELLAVPPKDTP